MYETDWDAQREIVIAEPFTSYVVHDAVALAGKADRLPVLYRRWSDFLVDGYDTIGECWGWGTRAHAWSCTPTRDMIFYTLGVLPAEPGYASVRVAPRLGGLAWARAKVPSPRGLISVEASRQRVSIDSPVPVLLDLTGQTVRNLLDLTGQTVRNLLDLPGQTVRNLSAGQHDVDVGLYADSRR